MVRRHNSERAGTRAFLRIEVEWDDAKIKGGWRKLTEYLAEGLVSCTAIGYRLKV